MNACQRWGEMVRLEHAQSERMRGEPDPKDYWTNYAQNFVADPRRDDDVLLDTLREHVKPHHSVLDVGAGAGRYALPLAMVCRELIAVEPSPAMVDALREQTASEGLSNISVVHSSWQDAEAPTADIAICCHVIYTVTDIDVFLDKLTFHAGKVIVVLFDSPPQAQLQKVWKAVYGEDRLRLPSLPELREVLDELGIVARIEPISVEPSRGYADMEVATSRIAERIYIRPGDEKMGTLERLLPDLLEERQGELRVKGAADMVPHIVSWGIAS